MKDESDPVGSNEPELEVCPHCNADDPGVLTDGSCAQCGHFPDSEPPFWCEFCDEETANDDYTCLKCGRHEDEIKPVDDRVLSELKKSKEGLSFGELAEKIHMQESKSRLSYHLGLLLGLNAIRKEKRDRKHPIYYFADAGETDMEVFVLSHLETDNFKQRSEEEIQKNLKMVYDEDEPIKTKYTLAKLELQDKITRKFDKVGTNGVAYYQIPFWKLPYDICHHCREKIEKHQLAVSYTMTNPADDREEFPIHATCRPHLHTNEFGSDTSESCCDYCGLHLRASEIEVDTDQKIVQSAVETLFDEPFSVLFSYHGTNGGYLDFHEQNGIYQDEKSATGKGFNNVGLAHFVTRNGKKYHPYCARQDAVVKKKFLMENSK